MEIKNLCASTISLAAALLVTATDPLYGQETLMFQHFGASDPASEGFSANIAPLAAVGPVIGDQGLDAWFTQGGGPATVFYSRALSAAERAQLTGANWTISLTLRVVQATANSANSFVSLATGAELFSLGFGSQANGDPYVRAYGTGATYVVAGGGSGYHNYQLRYNGLSGTAVLWVDGAERLGGIAAFGASQQALFEWGEGQGAFGWANWNQVSLSVPEPSSLALFITSGLFAAAYKHHSRSKR